MDIGRKVYYEKSTGNVICDTAERSGDVVETTTEQDFTVYPQLKDLDPATVGDIQLPFGQDADKFMTLSYSVDPVKQTIIWGSPLTPAEPVTEAATLPKSTKKK